MFRGFKKTFGTNLYFDLQKEEFIYVELFTKNVKVQHNMQVECKKNLYMKKS